MPAVTHTSTLHTDLMNFGITPTFPAIGVKKLYMWHHAVKSIEVPAVDKDGKKIPGEFVTLDLTLKNYGTRTGVRKAVFVDGSAAKNGETVLAEVVGYKCTPAGSVDRNPVVLLRACNVE